MSDDLWTLCLANETLVRPETLWSSWSLAPEVLAALAAALIAGWRARRRDLFLLGWSLLVLALVSPLCRLAATLVAGHMVQFMILLVPAPLCLALALGPCRGGLTVPTLAYGLIVWGWHLPGLYGRILTEPAMHLAAFLLLVLAAVWFWRAVLFAPRGSALLALAATLAHSGLLGAILTFAGTPLYPQQAAGALAWGLTPLEDQQLAGLIMWVPGGLLYLGAALALSVRWLQGVPTLGGAGPRK